MQRAWLREFNALGLQLRPQAAKDVSAFLRRCEDPGRMAELLVENTKTYLRSRQGTVEPIIDSGVIQNVIECMVEASKHAGPADARAAARQTIEGLDLGDGVHVYSAMTDVQPFEYARATKEWRPAAQRPGVLPGCEAKARVYSERYHLLLQRLLLEGRLVIEAEALAGALLPGQRVLTPVESLVGNPGRKLTFGLLSRLPGEGARRWSLEDAHQAYPLELAEGLEADGLVTDGSFVLAEGELRGGAFRATRLEAPPALPRRASEERDQVPAQAFGGRLTEEQLRALAAAGPGAEDESMYVVLCEVHLDSARVLEKLAEVLQGYEDSSPPLAYVLMGSFCSSPFLPTAEGVRSYREGFERLKFMLRGLARHVQRGTRFLLVPGPKDPGAQTLPRPPLSGYLTSDLARDVPGVVLGTNPCRVRHFGRDLVFFRHDVLRLLRRHEVVPPRDASGEAPSAQQVRQEMVRLLFDQAHLAPLPLEESNVLWAFDHTLRLYPLPHAVFIGGVSQPFECSYQGGQFCSVGPFHSDASFYAYYPGPEQLESCDVPDRAG